MGEADAGNAAAQVESVDGETGGSDAIVVTGSRIRGAAPASPTIQITGREIREAGQNDLGEVVRSLPQNFNGGQNPGVAQGAGSISNQNINSASAINLRGIGPDATLTLLNGRRLSYDSFSQAVDVSAIPLAAVDRIEIVPDGASAIYGSDAVAGVANVILKRDFDGLSTSARLGIATQGGGLQQQYNAVGGVKWSSGGFLAAYDYMRHERVTSDQRDYTLYLPRPTDLLPDQRRHAALITGHQDLGDIVTISLDALYNKRNAEQRSSPFSTSFRFAQITDTESYVISPTINLRLPGGWSATLNGVYGEDKSRYDQQRLIVATGAIISSAGCYCNDIKSVELGGEGPLFALPGGDARLAVGTGYRENGFKNFSTTSATSIPTIGDRKSYYGFGELFLPVIGAANDVAAVHGLSLTAALRYEDYDDLGSVTTPKLGLIYSPTPDVDLRGTWGRSFKAPTLLQGNQRFVAYLFPAFDYGSGLPDDATVLEAFGGNPDLKPERAKTWSVSAVLHPRRVKGLRAELSYFKINYRDRVLQPFTLGFGEVLGDPIYQEFLVLNPTLAQQQALIARSPDGLTNFSGVPYDPANVVAITNNLYTNVARQKISGVDLNLDYQFGLGGGEMGLSGRASWLKSRQRNTSLAPDFRLAGTAFNPPKFRARAGASWRTGGLTAAGFLNYIGGVIDTRAVPPKDGASMVTIDLTLLYRISQGPSLLRGLELSLSAQNVTDENPPYLRPIAPTAVNYDSTNYSALGRFISVGITKHW